MKKLIVLLGFAVVSLGVIGVAKADPDAFILPISAGPSRNVDTNFRGSGVEKCTLITSTNAALVTDRNGTTITDGLIDWVIRPSTGAVNSVYVEFRDTNTANLSSARLVPQIPPVANGAAVQTDQVMRFDPPIPFYNGLSVNLLPAGSSIATGVEFAVGVRPRN